MPRNRKVDSRQVFFDDDGFHVPKDGLTPEAIDALKLCALGVLIGMVILFALLIGIGSVTR